MIDGGYGGGVGAEEQGGYGLEQAQNLGGDVGQYGDGGQGGYENNAIGNYGGDGGGEALAAIQQGGEGKAKYRNINEMLLTET